MSLLDSTPLTSGLAESIHTKLQDASSPLKLADVAKGLPKPRKVKTADFQNEVQSILDEQIRLGQVFRYPSGKNGALRYWTCDEEHRLREKACELASTPQTLAALKKQLTAEVKGTDAAFIQSLIQELLAENKLFEHPAKTARGGSLLGATPPPPPLPSLEQPKYAKALKKLVADCQKLVVAAKVSMEELLQTMQRQLRNATGGENSPSIIETRTSHPPMATEPMPPSPNPETTQPPRAELDEIILKALSHAPVLSLAELRATMPAEYRGTIFDESVLRLADEQQVILSQDALPDRFNDAEKAEYVRDGDALFTTIAKWSQ